MCTLSLPSAGADRFARRSRGEAAGGSAPACQLILRYLQRAARLSRSRRRSGRVGAHVPLTGQRTSRPLARTCAPRSAARRPHLLPLLPLLRLHLQWPLVGPLGSRSGSLVGCRARSRDRASPPGAYGVPPWQRRLLERRGCSVCACCDRVSDRTLGGDHVGDVQPPGAQLGARMSAQECSGALGLVGQSRPRAALYTICVRGHNAITQGG